MSQCKVLAIVNQKGGVGKTTTAFNLGVALSQIGKRVLLVDADPQSDLTTCMGWDNQDKLDLTLADLMEQSINDEPIKVREAILHYKEKVDLIPSNLGLSALEMMLVNAMSREYTMKNCLSEVKHNYDYIIIDCMPSLGMITVNALASADGVIIPVQTQYLAAKGMTQLLKIVSKVKRQINPSLKVEGVLLTLVDRRTNLSKAIQKQLQENYGSVFKVFDAQIPIAISTAESTSQGKSVFLYDKIGKVAESYAKVARKVDNFHKERIKHKIAQDR